MGRRQDAERHFEDALAFNLRIGARLFLAHTQHAYGRILLDAAGQHSGDLSHARELLHAALTIYDDLGVEHQAAKVRALQSGLFARAPR
jgi:hypothetical protein